MSVQGRLEELSRRHQELEARIHEEQKRPAADGLAVKALKRQKLRIKQEINQLAEQTN